MSKTFTKNINVSTSRGLIIVGYQGIGKSTYASTRTNAIDLESSNFKVDGERSEDWQVIYCRIAVSLAKQGFIVFTSSHQCVVEEFMKYYTLDENYNIVIIAPDYSLENKWVEKLRQRWLEDTRNEKNEIAYKDADENFQNEIYWLASQDKFLYLPIMGIHYSLRNIVTGLCLIYGVNSLNRSYQSYSFNYNDDE